MSWLSPDPMLARIERTALVFGVIAVAAAWLLRGGRPDVATGVAGGWLLVALSYLVMRAAVARWIDVGGPAGPAAGGATPSEGGGGPKLPERAAKGRAAVAFLARYALLGVIAYVMIARLRLHVFGLLVGASSVLVAATIEAFRTLVPPRTR